MVEREGRLLGFYIIAFIVLGVVAAALGAGVFRQVAGGAIFGGLIGGVAFAFYKYKVKDQVEWILGVSFFLLLLVTGWSVNVTRSSANLEGDKETPELSAVGGVGEASPGVVGDFLSEEDVDDTWSRDSVILPKPSCEPVPEGMAMYCPEREYCYDSEDRCYRCGRQQAAGEVCQY